MQNNLITEKPVKIIIRFALPILMGNLIQQLYYIIDTIIVGQYLGMNALAAVGSTGSLTFLVIGWIIGMTGGFAIIIAHCFGANDRKRVKHYVAMSYYLCVIMGLIMSVGLLLANEWILKAMNTPVEIFDQTYRYIRAIYIGLIFSIAYNIFSAILRALGDSRTPLYFLVLSSILNIALDIIFITAFKMEVEGAGYATVISQALASVLCFIYMLKKYSILRLKKEDTCFSVTSVKRLLGMGTPMALQFSITAIGTIIVQTALNGFGPIYIAAFTASSKIQNFIIQPFISMGAAVATFTGQNIGAGKMDRVKEGVRISFVLTLLCSVLLIIFVLAFGDELVSLFIKDNRELVLEKTDVYFKTMIGFYPALGLIFVYRNALQGLGDGLLAMLGGIFELVARAMIIFALTAPLGFQGICLSDPIAWVAALIPLIPAYYYRINKVTHSRF